MFEHRSRSGAVAAPGRSDGTPIGVLTVRDVDPSVRTMAGGTRNNAVGMVVDRLAGFGVMLVLALLLSPRSLGSFYEISALFALLTAIGLLGLDVGVIRSTAAAVERGHRDEIRSYLRAALAVSTIGSATLAAGLWFAAPWLAQRLGEPALVTAIRIMCPAIPLATATWILVAPARGIKDMVPGVLAIQVTQPMVQLIVTFVLLRHAPTAAAAALAFAISIGAGLLVATALARRTPLPVLGCSSTAAVAGPLLRFSLPVSGMVLIDAALLWIDTLLLGFYRTAPQVATYGLIARLMTLGFAAMLTVTTIFGPFVSQYVERRDREALQRTLRTATRWAVLIACPIILAIVVFGPRLLDALHQDGSDARPVIGILAVAFLVDALTGPVGNALTMSGRSALNFRNNLVALVVNIGLNLVLIPPFGMVGAALAWAVVIVGLNVARVVQVRRVLDVSPFGRGLWKPVASGAAAAGIALAAMRLSPGDGGTPLGLLAGGLLFAGTYAAAFLLLRPDPEDLMLLHTLVGGRHTTASERAAPHRRAASVAGWIVPSLIAVGIGAAVGTESTVGLAAAAVVIGIFVVALVPMAWLAYASVFAFTMFRLVSPASTGAASYVPDALLVLIVFKAGFDLAVGRVERRNAMRWLAAPLLLFLAIAVVSWLGHGAGVRSLFAAMRQYLRFPVWALALAACGIGWQHARRMMWILLGVALLQLPFALHEIGHPINAASLLPGTHFFAGDNISGTFGLGGSNSAMVFLTLAALVWLALVLYRVVPAWVLMIVAPAIVIPMALGSAAVFVLLLPAAVIALLVRASLTRGAPITVGVLVAGALVLGLVGFGARSFALAPGLNGTSQVSAASALNVDYLNAYVTETSGAGPSRRLGFLSVALHSTVFDGAQRAFLGLGPQTAVIGMQDVQVGPTSLSVLATASVQSVPRILLGFGVLGLIAYMILLVMPGLKMSGLEGVDRTARALALMLPVATGVYVLAGFYNAAWSDPGISCAYWTIVLATYAGSRPISPSVEGALR